MATRVVECLHCGQQRLHDPDTRHGHDAGECPRCTYVGWAVAAELSERTRRQLRDRPPAARRLRSVPVA